MEEYQNNHFVRLGNATA